MEQQEIVQEVVQEVVSEVIQEVSYGVNEEFNTDILVQLDHDSTAVMTDEIGVNYIPDAKDGLVPPEDLEKYYCGDSEVNPVLAEALNILTTPPAEKAPVAPTLSEYLGGMPKAIQYQPFGADTKRVAEHVGITEYEYLLITGNFTNPDQLAQLVGVTLYVASKVCNAAADQGFIVYSKFPTFSVTSLGRVVASRFENAWMKGVDNRSESEQ